MTAEHSALARAQRLSKKRIKMSAGARTLYRRILALHRRLPLEQKALGDQYVKAEFRRHINVSKEQALEFLQEWEVKLNDK